MGTFLCYSLCLSLSCASAPSFYFLSRIPTHKGTHTHTPTVEALDIEPTNKKAMRNEGQTSGSIICNDLYSGQPNSVCTQDQRISTSSGKFRPIAQPFALRNARQASQQNWWTIRRSGRELQLSGSGRARPMKTITSIMSYLKMLMLTRTWPVLWSKW